MLPVKKIFFFSFAMILMHVSCKQEQDVKVSFNDKQLLYEGRIGYTNDAAVLSWPGTSVYINFEGSEIKADCKESDSANYYNVIVDGKIVGVQHFDTVRNEFLLASSLSPGKHSLQLFKRTEWDKGKTFLFGFSGKGLKLLPPPAKPKRKIEFYGNSISCGYAIEDYAGDLPIGFYENNYDAYPALTARHFNAQYQCIAKSGIGITISWFPLVMKEMYDRLDAEEPGSKWNFNNYVPDVVVINLLQNDYWLVNMPDHPEYKSKFGAQKPASGFIINEYKNFVQTIRSKYPLAKIICMLGNMDITSEGSAWPSYVTAATNQLNDKNIYTLFVPYKNTAGHPKTNEQKALAGSLIAFIENNIVW